MPCYFLLEITVLSRYSYFRTGSKYSLAAVNYVGHSTNRDFGHDTSWARVSSADVSPAYRNAQFGWAGKLADQCYATDPLAVFSLRGRTLTAEGGQSKVNIVGDLAGFGSSNPPGGPAYNKFMTEAFRRTRKADPVLSNISDRALQSAWDTLDFSADKLGQIVATYNAIPAAQRATYGTDPLSLGFLNAARLIRSGQLKQGSIHLSQGGWDVHQSALESVERLTTTLNGAVGAFLADMELGGKDVIVLIWHAFGRNTFQNANTALSPNGQTISVPGCDHGHGRTAWVFRLGSKIRPGVHGPTGYRADDFLNPTLVTGALGWMPGGDVTRDRGVDVPGVDFREVLSQVLQQAGADPADIIPGAFPKSSYGLQIFR